MSAKQIIRHESRRYQLVRYWFCRREVGFIESIVDREAEFELAKLLGIEIGDDGQLDVMSVVEEGKPEGFADRAGDLK